MAQRAVFPPDQFVFAVGFDIGKHGVVFHRPDFHFYPDIRKIGLDDRQEIFVQEVSATTLVLNPLG